MTTDTFQRIRDLRERNAECDQSSRVVALLLADALIAADAQRIDEADKLVNAAEHELIVHEIKQAYGAKSHA